MSAEAALELDERTSAALEELKGLILARYPEATFDVAEGEDPDGIYLRATVDVEDTDEVMDICIDRLLELQIDEGLDVYVIPLEPMERVAARMRANPFVARPHRITADGKLLLD